MSVHRFKTALLCFLLLSLQHGASAQTEGPFGFEMGKPVGDFSGCKPAGDFFVECKSAPKMHPAFETYTLFYTQEAGICAVIATGKEISTNSSGTQLKSEADELAGDLTRKYGPPKPIDMLTAGSIWKDSHEWMMALRKNDRYYRFYWMASDGVKLPNNLMNIGLNAYASRVDQGYLSLRYEFRNHDVCVKARKSKASGAL